MLWAPACDAQGENADRCTDQVVSKQRLCSRSAQRVLPERGCEPRHGDGDARGDQQVGEQVEQRSPGPACTPCPDLQGRSLTVLNRRLSFARPASRSARE